MCREHGQQLTELAASEPEIFSGFGIFGVIKETGVDDAGLRVFEKDHFSFPLYRDGNLDFYRAFGDGKITDQMSWRSILNPYKIYKELQAMNQRMTSKNLEGNLIGEGLKTGGIIVFGGDGEPKYAYPEITGYALETDDIVAALKDVSSGSNDEL